MPKLSRKRLGVVFSFFIVTLLVLFFRLGFIQIFKYSRYLSLAQSQSRAVVEMQPVRGRILDRMGRELALDLRLDSLYAVSREIKDKREVFQKLVPILAVPREELWERLHRDKLFVWLARKLTDSQAAAVKKLKLEGLGYVKESLRVYPKGQTACHLIGFTDVDNNGLEGMELYCNSFLKGIPGWRLAQKDAKQRELISKELEMMPPVEGCHLHLTIDEVIQSLADKELAESCQKYHAEGGSIIVMDPKTGDILAMSTYPMYDLNQVKKTKPEVRRNRAVTDIFEPGSVFKAITLSAILENKTFSLDEKFYCENGSWAVAGKILHDHKGHGTMSFREIIEKSSNIGTVKGAMRLGAAKLYKTMRDFGFGEKTGVTLMGEVNGLVLNPKSWSRSSIINIPIGQGVAVTPIQLVSAFAAIANNGMLMKPRVLMKIDDSEGRVLKSFEPELRRQVISKETSLRVRSVLEGVVSRGTGKKAIVPGFKAAGKTGTAQKLLADGTYSHDHFIGSFVGFVPYDEPKLVIAVSLDGPHPIYYGGEVAAPAFSRLAGAILAYWQIPQQKTPSAVLPVNQKIRGRFESTPALSPASQ